jgi:hypothetical protein
VAPSKARWKREREEGEGEGGNFRNQRDWRVEKEKLEYYIEEEMRNRVAE